MILLRLLSWPYLRKHVVRSLLTIAGVVLGVAVFVGMYAANRSVVGAFSQTIDRIAGKTELQVTAGETGFGEDVLEKVQSAASVRVAVPAIESMVDSRIPGEGNLLVLGVDMTGDRSLRDYDLENDANTVIDDPLIFLAQPDSIILSKEFADRHAIAPGRRLPLGTVDGVRTFTVRGIVKSQGLMSAFGGNLAIMDVYAAQKMFGRGRTFDRIDIGVKPGVPLAESQRELAALLGPGFEIQPPASRAQQIASVLNSYSTMVTISSVFALFVGMFIIYNSFAIAVAQRRSEIGILRALGATQAQIQWLFLGESVVTGLIGSVIGVAAGVMIAGQISSSVSAVVSDVYFVAQKADEPSLGWWLPAVAVAVGVLTSVIAAAIPARSAASVDPLYALQKGKQHQVSANESRIRLVAALASAVVAAALLLVDVPRPLFYVAYGLAAIVVPVLLGPLLSVLLVRAFRPVMKRLQPVEGALAADSLIQAPRRTSATVIGLTLSLSLVIAFAGIARSSYRSIVDWVDETFSCDLFVLASANFNVQTSRLPSSMAAEIMAIPGVERVERFRTGRTMFRNTPITIMSMELGSVAETAPRKPVAGNAADMYRRAARGEGLIVSENLALLQGLQLGETVDVHAPYGVIHLPIAGIVTDYFDQQGTIILDRTLFVQYWHDDSVRDFRVFVREGTPASDVRNRVVQLYAGKRQIFVLTNAELRNYILNNANQWFGLTWIQIAVAVLVGALGIVNTLTVSIIDRRRELGVLRAVGALHRQIRRTIRLEALLLTMIGLILGSVFGGINLYYILDAVRRDVAGIRLAYMFPLPTVIALVPGMLTVGLVSALWPSYAAVRAPLVEALEYE